MPIIRKLRTVVRKTDASAETDYMVVSVKKMKGSCPGKAKYGTLPIKYYFDKTRSKCINTFEGVFTEEEFIQHFTEKYDIQKEHFETTLMHSEKDGYKLFLVFIKDFERDFEEMKSSVSFELFKLNAEEKEVDKDDVFQKVIKYHQEYGINFKKNQFYTENKTTKVKPLKLWKTMTGNSL